MPEVTDSYCERCGSRYVFNPSAPIGLSLKGARVLAKGLKNFVLTDGQSMSDSIALARHENETQDSSRVTDAFHRTFNFCLTCRQYACDRCWNVKTGACLSCTPENGQVRPAPRESIPQRPEPMRPPLETTAPREPMFTQPAPADWEADWSVFAEASSAKPDADQAAPTGFNEPIKLPEPAPKTRRTTAPAEWPQADLPKGEPDATRGTNAKGTHRAARKQADIDAASLWPLADEIAPEMTLTAEELELVETRLGSGDPIAEPAIAEPVVVAATPVVAPATPPVTAEPDYAYEQFVLAEPVRPEQAAEWGASWRTASPSSWEMQPVSGRNRGPASMPTYSAEGPEIETASEFVPLPPDDAPPAASAHLLSLQLPSVAEMGPPPKPQEHSPLVGRIFSRKGSSHRGRQDAEAWPQVTRWSERPVKSADWIDAALAEQATQSEADAQAVPEPEFVAPVRPFFSRDPEAAPPATPELSPVPAPKNKPASFPAQNAHEAVDARSAAAVRLSAVGGIGELSAVPAAPETTPAWPEADRDVVEARTRRQEKGAESRKEPGPPKSQPPTSYAPEPMPAAPVAPPVPPSVWPPLGASWPAPQNPGSTWPGPEAMPIPAAVAAQSAQTATEPTLAEMWEQSSQEVLNRGTVRVCQRCALPVSTQARFCRRCGTRQG